MGRGSSLSTSRQRLPTEQKQCLTLLLLLHARIYVYNDVTGVATGNRRRNWSTAMRHRLFALVTILQLGFRLDGRSTRAFDCLSEVIKCTKNWKRRLGRPRHTWLRTVEADLRPFNLGLASGFRKAQDRTTWRALTGTATLPTSPE